MRSPLPQNVVKTIIAFVDDRSTLYHCALTCRGLLPASRLNLLYDVAINPARFNHLASMASVAFLAPYFYSLQLFDDERQPWIHTFFDRFSIILFHIRYLVLIHLQGQRHPVVPSDIFPRHRYTSLRTLTISNGTFDSFAHFQNLVNAFPQVSRLMVEGVEWSPLCSTSGGTESRGPLLEQLWFNSRNDGEVTMLVDWILRTPSALSIRDLNVGSKGVLSAHDFPAVQRLTDSLGQSLEHFEVSLRHWSQNSGMDLSRNTCLQTLYVRDVDAGAWENFLLLLGHRVSPTALTHISFDLHVPTLEDFHAFQACFQAGLDDGVLAQKDFSQLQGFTVWLRAAPPSMTPLELVKAMELCMPAFPSGCLYQVKPWWDLGLGRRSD
ncbi:hypothetical protein LXA43DRAFT_900913 [Ganoderma leucocontextum]|nr:hypothetical protein LXA43DRAFT_900913 [Ganoderma leucocontextum]